ncbi:MAG: DEAD/DEAH box helicase [Acidobacteriia bacterium]|nr:DEAD/DEAH box helicase [Terriglobia bacterium]
MPRGYEHRAAQLEMAEVVQEAFESHQHAIVEAGTGTGKTLAYLIPALMSGRRVVISTATKSLQEQLYQKDVPFLQKHFAPELKVAVMKGRSNFLCWSKMDQMGDQPMLAGLEELVMARLPVAAAPNTTATALRPVGMWLAACWARVRRILPYRT